jgi:glutamate-1-semialdehyde 2,1-aminomutase
VEAIQITNPIVVLGLTLAIVLSTIQIRHWLLGLWAQRAGMWTGAALSRCLGKLVSYYELDEAAFFSSDGAPEDVRAARRRGFFALSSTLTSRAPESIALTQELQDDVSDALFTDCHRIPFPFRGIVRRYLQLGTFVDETRGAQIKDIDGNWAYDLGGSYGVNLFGYDFYKECIHRGAERVCGLGPVLGPVHPIVAENAAMLRRISKLDEVSFHMSGTEAVMQAVGLARFHTGRRRVAVFSGAYHGWWNGVQARGIPGKSKDLCILREQETSTLKFLGTRKDIACVLVNPVQAMHPNRAAPGDAMLLDSSRAARFDRDAYAAWLRELRKVCTERSIVLIFDEVFVGFRLGLGGGQEYFGIRADMVTYGKTIGGGLPVGVVCGKRSLMKRFREDLPTQVCFARGTFNAHPYVMGAMNEFLRRLDDAPIRSQLKDLDSTWNERAAALNARLAERDLPLRIVNLVSIWTVVYTQPSRYNWMLQYYLRAEGLALSWIGTGRLILPHNSTGADCAAIFDRIVGAAEKMRADGWWWQPVGASNAAIRRRIAAELLMRGMLRRNPAASPPRTLTAKNQDLSR